MKSPEEVKTALECCFQYRCCIGCPYQNPAEQSGKCVEKMGIDALLNLIQLEAQVPKWVSEKDDIPELNAYKLMIGAKGAMFIGKIIAENNLAMVSNRTDMTRRFTHWMNLPEPPQKGENNIDQH